MKSRAYRSRSIKDIDAVRLAQAHAGAVAVVGADIGKFEIYLVVRWGPDDFERPWRVENPSGIAAAVRVLQAMKTAVSVRVALESSGTYGEAWRQALTEAGLAVLRVGTKASRDYAEVFDGVPSQHDGKDAAVIAELAALGKGTPWPYRPRSEWEQELRYWVEDLDSQRRVAAMWEGRLEAWLAQHWPEATRSLRLTSGTLLRVLQEYGGPAGLAADERAGERLRAWGGPWLTAERIAEVLTVARQTAGVRPARWEEQQAREWAAAARQARQRQRRGRGRLSALAAGHPVLQAQGRVVGLPTACVLWVGVGDPRDYRCAAAYRKALGLNLKEKSSGVLKGQVRVTKRGNARGRQWLYLAAVRLVRQPGVRGWYEAKKVRQGGRARRALVAVMRKLAVGLHAIGVSGVPFEARRLFRGQRLRRRATADRPG